MPINATVEYYKAEEAYSQARTREEKISRLEEMIRLLPKHKGTENLLADLKKRLAKLKSQKEKKGGTRTAITIKKEGVAQVCLIGLPNSGKSTLLRDLTGVDVAVANYPYTTVKPEVGMLLYEDVRIQVIEIPSTFDPETFSPVFSCDLIALVIDGKEHTGNQKKELLEILEKKRIKTNKIFITTKKKADISEIKKKIWENVGVIRVYTKTRRGIEKKPIVLKKNSTVEDAVKEVHKSFLKHFRFARVWGNSVKFDGAQVGLDHVLHDKDVVKIYA